MEIDSELFLGSLHNMNTFLTKKGSGQVSNYTYRTEKLLKRGSLHMRWL
jgi:hypothetical protein